MSDDGYGATIAKRKLARRLYEMRRASGHTANHVCDLLDWGRGKVGRFEANHWKRPEMSDIRDLLRVYGSGEETRQEIEELAILSRQRPWWRDYSDIFENEFPGYENDASRIRVAMPLILPGLMQTPEYTEAVMRVAAKPPSWRERATQARLRRQQVLERPDGTVPQVLAVISEAAVLFKWGTRDERRDQIEHLVALSRRPNVELRLQRFADGPFRGMWSMVNIFDFPGGEPSVVYLETDTAIQEVSEPEAISVYGEGFSRSRDAALDPADTVQYLRYLCEQLE